jgi:RNase P subunit RPR2
MVTCANCGQDETEIINKTSKKRLFGKSDNTKAEMQIWDSQIFKTELNGKPICKDCYKNLKSAQSLASKCADNSRKYNGTTQKVSKVCSSCAFIVRTPVLINTVEKHDLFDWAYGSITGETKVNHQYADKCTCSKFGFEVTHKQAIAETCTSYITKEEYEKNCLNGQVSKENKDIQIILDFSSLKDIMAKGGLVMTTYKCPNCGGMVNIPEAGKVLMCQYCGAPIKPVDIFEKIKSIIQ